MKDNFSIFKKDIFSRSKPKWRKYKNKNLEKLIYTKFFDQSESLKIYKLNGNEINSKNYKIISKKKIFVLKEEIFKNKKQLLDLEKKFEVLYYLKNKIPLVMPEKLYSGKRYIVFYGKIWTLTQHVDGNYFSGKDNELLEIAKNIRKLVKALSKLNKNKFKINKFIYFSKNENDLIKILNKKRSKWKNIFGRRNSILIKKNWNVIVYNWNRLKNLGKINKGNIQLMHWDLHPHNFLFRNNKIKAILDFASLRFMPVGYSLAYSTVKNVRQNIVKYGKKQIKNNFTKNYIKEINSAGTKKIYTSKDFYHLAMSEILRRIFIILRLNVKKNDKSWNHILPILINHIDESKRIFL